ncbi:hypothetical protein ACFL1X_01470 [Candidatus Hydrogenedentota bacterium]
MNKPEHEVTIFEPELELMAGNCLSYESLETGGALGGLRTRDAKSVIFLITPPGSGAFHEPAYFRQDKRQYDAVQRVLCDEYRLELSGGWHWHHSIGLDHTSGRDDGSIESIFSKNDIADWIEIICTDSTTHSPRDIGRPCAPLKRFLLWSLKKKRALGRSMTRSFGDDKPSGRRIKISVYRYLNVQPMRIEKCRVRILRAVSPMRYMIENAGCLLAAPLAFESEPLPLEYIELDQPAQAEGDRCEHNHIPQALQDQWLRLPESILETSSAFVEGEKILLNLELPSGHRLGIVHMNEPPHRVSGVYIEHPGEEAAIDMTPEILGLDSHMSAQMIYLKIMRIMDSIEGYTGFQEQQDSSESFSCADGEDPAEHMTDAPDDISDKTLRRERW